MVKTFTLKYLYQDSIYLSEIRIVQKAIENYQGGNSAFHSITVV